MSHCRTDVQDLTWEEGPAPLPAGCLAYRPAAGRRVPAARLPSGSLPQGTKMRLKQILFTFRSLPPGRRAVGGRPPRSRAVGVHNCKLYNQKYISVKNDFEKYKNKKTPAYVDDDVATSLAH